MALIRFNRPRRVGPVPAPAPAAPVSAQRGQEVEEEQKDGGETTAAVNGVGADPVALKLRLHKQTNGVSSGRSVAIRSVGSSNSFSSSDDEGR